MKCSPFGLKHRINETTCLDNDAKEEIEKNIETKKCNHIKHKAKREICQLSKTKKVSKYYLPKMPKEWSNKNNNSNKNWLSNFDITNIINQYAELHPNFKFIGTLPIDFIEKKYGENQCISEIMCNFDKYITNNQLYDLFGFAINTDKSNGSGKHWFALVINMKKQTIYCFDSVGNASRHKAIKDWVNRTSSISNFTLLFSKNEHQQKNTECGMYSVLFILSMIYAEDTDQIWNLWEKQTIPDNQVFNFRKYLFMRFLKKKNDIIKLLN